ncbi:iron complex transport system substrate-binding protein [Carnobacterium alterfunditum]|uniref:Iron complex transport system substrate-binding protein n=1 Tax=Carnobacterium alterfunditum TaxID=28230 RepID=A0A1N6FW59_9LACT|nr:ABC transporter substrate-binding protein [Carnobacterium alterfunditum]SIN99447.1 iron complex transport system substrate-binding protein [Carnobacterium alterfunditum]
MNTLKMAKYIGLVTVSSLLLGACGQENAAEEQANVDEKATEQAAETTFPLTLNNYTVSSEGAVFSKKEITYESSPKSIVANNQGTAELLLQIGLAEDIIGVAALYGEGDETVAEDFASIPVLAEGYVGKELVVGADPDIVVGRGQLFASTEWGTGTVEELNEVDIQTYVQATSTADATFDDLYTDIANLGKLFTVEEKAQQFSTDVKIRMDAIVSGIPANQEALEYAYLFGAEGTNVEIYSGAADTYLNDALSYMDLNNTFADATGEISAEALLEADPDVLFLVNYTGGRDPKESLADLKANDALSSLTAIKEDRIYTIDYNQFWSYGYQILTGMEQLSAELYGEN